MFGAKKEVDLEDARIGDKVTFKCNGSAIVERITRGDAHYEDGFKVWFDDYDTSFTFARDGRKNMRSSCCYSHLADEDIKDSPFDIVLVEQQNVR